MSVGPLHVTVMSVEHAFKRSAAPTVLRTRALGERFRAVTGSAIDALDDVFAGNGSPESDWRDDLLERLNSAAIDGTVCYAVPGHPLLGDVTVQHLVTLARTGAISLEIVEVPVPPALADVIATHSGSVAFVDVLSILGADAQRPFSGGSLPLSSNQAVVICNVVPERDGMVLADVLCRRYQPATDITLIQMEGLLPSPHSTLDELRAASERSVCWLAIGPAAKDVFYRSADDLQRLVARLRAPEGCPWDREQTNRSLTRNLIEESYELLDAIESGDADAVREELGDFLLQAFLHSQIAEEDGNFRLEDVLSTLIEKLVRRHPHVFATTLADDSDAVVRNWDEIKRAERAEKREDGARDESPLGDVPAALPALLRAQSLLKRAVRSGMNVDEIREHRSRAADAVADDSIRVAVIGSILTAIEEAGVEGIDLEELLRNWTRTFEASIARGDEVDSRH